MSRTRNLATFVAALLICSASWPALAAAPSFGANLYADGQTFGTKGTTGLPAPTADNVQSFDVLYVFTNSNNPAGQLAVAEAAPGNPAYNGGRWFTHTVEWTEAGFLAHGIVPVLTSADEVHYHEQLGHLVITPGSFPDGPPVYFQCPLLPDKTGR
jgi:hypothetical protein